MSSDASFCSSRSSFGAPKRIRAYCHDHHQLALCSLADKQRILRRGRRRSPHHHHVDQAGAGAAHQLLHQEPPLAAGAVRVAGRASRRPGVCAAHMAFLALTGPGANAILSVLDELERVDKHQIIEWVYSLQVHPDKNDRTVNASDCGFRGGPFRGNVFACNPSDYVSEVYDTGNIASTYAALCILRTLGDDLSRVNKPAVIGALRHLQNKHTGSFSSLPYGSEEDMRFVYCASAISYILDDWSGFDSAAMVRYVNSCLTYDGAIGIGPDTESHAGAVFCAVAALVLSGRLMQLSVDQSELVRWLVFRQQSGFQGRCNKDPDTCYAFWNGATLDLLGKHSFVDIPSCQAFVYSCQFPFGGIAKFPDTMPDVMHSYYSLAWLSIASNQRKAHSKSAQDGEDDEELHQLQELPNLVPLDTKLQVPFFPKPSSKR